MGTRRESVRPSARTSRSSGQTDRVSTKAGSVATLGESAQGTGSSLNMSSTQTGNFYADFQALVKEYDAPATLLNILDGMPPSEPASTPAAATPGPGATADGSTVADMVENDEIVYGKHFQKGPCIITVPNRNTPSTYYLRGFKIDGPTMKAFVKAVEANPTKTVAVHISRCNLTEEGYDTLITEANFNTIKRLTLIGPISTKPTTLDFTRLFSCSLETLKLNHWALTDDFLDSAVPALQKNDSLALLSLDFNRFSRRDHIETVLRINRKLVFISMRDATGGTKTSTLSAEDADFTKEMLSMNRSELEQLRSIKLKTVAGEDGGSPTLPAVPSIFMSDKIERKDNKVYFPGNTVFKKLVF